MRFFVICIVTIATVLAILSTDGNGYLAQRPLSGGSVYFVTTAAIGAALGVFVVREHIGGEGFLGFLTTIMAFYFATLIGGFVSGTLIFPVVGTFFALMFVCVVPVNIGSGAIAWWCGVLILHFVTLHLLPEKAE